VRVALEVVANALDGHQHQLCTELDALSLAWQEWPVDSPVEALHTVGSLSRSTRMKEISKAGTETAYTAYRAFTLVQADPTPAVS